MVQVSTNPLYNNLGGGAPDGLSMYYKGTVTVNGTASQTVTEPNYIAGDVVLFGLLTVGGTVGAVPTVKTGTTGTGFTVAATASDTSVYTYIGFHAQDQQ